MMVNEADYFLKDEDELIMNGKKIREYRDICRNEGYKQAIENVLNLPIKEFVGDYKQQIYDLQQDFYKKIMGKYE